MRSLLVPVIGVLLTLLVIAQIVWLIRQNSIFNRYKRMWEAAHAKWCSAEKEWQAANYENDKAGMLAAFDKERRYYRDEQAAYRAELAVNRDLFLPPWKWIKRWNYDYLAEPKNMEILK
jgi:hypothetical protein